MGIIGESFLWAEGLLGARLCVHDYQDALWDLVEVRFRKHGHPLCVAAKALKIRHCLQADQVAVRERLQRAPDLFWKRCHAGYLEAVHPVRFRGRNVGALFAGPWSPRSALGNAREALGLLSPAPKTTVDLGLAVLDEGALVQVERVLAILAALLERELGNQHSARPGGSDRRAAISNFIEHGFHDELRLSQLARALGLSDSRASQLVRALFRATFPQLVASRRLEYASDLLRETALPVAAVAAHAGFPDPRYFQRLFRRRFSLSPRRYRLKSGHRPRSV